MAGDDQSSSELGKNSAEAMVNQTKSTGRQSEGRRAHLGVYHGWRRPGGVAGLEEEEDGFLRTIAAMRTTQREREKQGKTLVASSPIPEARQQLMDVGIAANGVFRGGGRTCSARRNPNVAANMKPRLERRRRWMQRGHGAL